MKEWKGQGGEGKDDRKGIMGRMNISITVIAEEKRPIRGYSEAISQLLARSLSLYEDRNKTVLPLS